MYHWRSDKREAKHYLSARPLGGSLVVVNNITVSRKMALNLEIILSKRMEQEKMEWLWIHWMELKMEMNGWAETGNSMWSFVITAHGRDILRYFSSINPIFISQCEQFKLGHVPYDQPVFNFNLTEGLFAGVQGNCPDDYCKWIPCRWWKW